jgi:hypothetical protein
VRLHERHAGALARVGDEQLRPIGRGRVEVAQRGGERADVVAVAAGGRPAERARLGLEVAQRRDVLDPRVGLDLVVVDDRGDLAHALGGGRGQRLPELPLLQLAVARQHVDPAAAAAQPPGADEALRLGDAHAQRAGARVDLRHRRDVGVAGQAAEAAQAVDEVEVDAAHSGEHRVHRRRVVALGGERHVVVAEDLEVQPREHVEAAEARAEVARARAHDHRQDVQAACVGERGRPRDRVGVERADAPELARRDVVDGDAVGAVGAPFPHGQTSSGSWWMYSVLRSE